jgi:4-hydroxy-tetrahydrodipicolinate synthase
LEEKRYPYVPHYFPTDHSPVLFHYRTGGLLMKRMHVAVPTPFYPDEQLHVEGFAPILAHLTAHGIDAMLICGSTGEQHSLTIEERIRIIAYFNEQQFPNVELLFGVAAVRTADAVRLVQAVEDSVFSGLLIGFPPYILPTKQQAVRYVEALLEHTSKPVVLYNNPPRTGFDLHPDALHELVTRHPQQIVGIKDVSDIRRHQQSAFPASFLWFAAGDKELAARISHGCNALSSITANVYPAETRQAFADLLAQYPVDLVELERRVQETYQGQPVVQVKKHYHKLGMIDAVCRAPLGEG